MPDRNRRQDRHRRPQPDVPVIHEATPYEPPASLARLASPFVFIPIGIAAGLVLFLIAFAMRNDTGGPVQAGPIGTPTATSIAGTPTEGPTPTPDPRLFEKAENVTDPANVHYQATITTDKGTIVISLFEDVAPNTVNNFVFLAEKGFYDNLTWHRVVPNFVIQAGDPRSEVGREGDESTQDGPGYTTADEKNDLANTRGRISMAKVSGQTVFGSQFFINLKDNPALDDANSSGDAYYPFGEVIEGMDVADKVEQGDVIESITIQELPKPEPTATPTP